MTKFSRHQMVGRIIGDWRSKDNLFIKSLIGFALVLLIALMFPKSDSGGFSIHVGAVWTSKDLVAPFSFPILKDQHVYEKEKREAGLAVYPVFERHEDVEEKQLKRLTSVINTIQQALDSRFAWMKSHAEKDSLRFIELRQSVTSVLTEQQWNTLLRWKSITKYSQELQRILADALRIGIIDTGKFNLTNKHVAVRKGTTEEIIPLDQVFDVTEALMQMRSQNASRYGESDTASMLASLLRSVVIPNIVFNEGETRRAILIAESNVPRSVGYVHENERIVSKYETVTDDVKRKLDAFIRAKEELGSHDNRLFEAIGIILHVVLILGLYSMYLYYFRKKIFHDNMMLVLIGGLILIPMALAYLSHLVNSPLPMEYIILIPGSAMLLTIMFDSRVAFYGVVTMSFLIGGVRGNDYTIAATALVAGAVSVYTVRDIKNRTQIFRSMVSIFLAYALSIVALGFERFDSLESVGAALLLSLLNAIASPVLTYGLLIFFERSINISTDLTLMELMDVEHPLLRQLSEKAPGTYHHSLTLGNLTETAANAIGANDVLAKVGAYYHDIGKILKPEYFVENQTGTNNKHKRMSPRASARLIITHVQEGIELARKYRLPERVIDFIAQHHGTTRNSFFYDKALKQATVKNLQRSTIRESDFCYPGPKPQTKETGILMLADLVEASTRTMTTFTPEKLERTIDNLIKRRFIEGQLDDCDLTLKDLRKIKESFLKILTGIHHQRIVYPDQEQVAVPIIETAEEITEPVVEEFTVDESSEESSIDETQQPQSETVPPDEQREEERTEDSV